MKAIARPSVILAVLCSAMATACGTPGTSAPQLAGFWAAKKTTSRRPLSLGIAWTGSTMMFAADGYVLSQAYLEVATDCTSDWSVKDGRLTYTSDPTSLYGGMTADSATLDGDKVDLTWEMGQTVNQSATDAYKQDHPTADPNLSVAVGVSFTGTLSGDKLTLDATTAYKDAANGQVLTTDTWPGLSLTRVDACPFQGVP